MTVVALWCGLYTMGKLPNTWTNFVTVLKGQFPQPSSHTEATQALMNLSSQNISSLEDYVHHTRIQIQKSGLEGDNNCFFCQSHLQFGLSLDSARQGSKILRRGR